MNNINFPSQLSDMNWDVQLYSAHDGQYLVVEKDFKYPEENTAETEICNLFLEDRYGESCQCVAYGDEAQRLNRVKEDDVVFFTDVFGEDDTKRFMGTSNGFQILIEPTSGIHINPHLSGKRNEWSTKAEILRCSGRKATLRYLRIQEVRDMPGNSGSFLNSYWRTKDGRECQLALYDNKIDLLPDCLEKDELYNLYGMKLARNQNYADLCLEGKRNFKIRKI